MWRAANRRFSCTTVAMQLSPHLSAHATALRAAIGAARPPRDRDPQLAAAPLGGVRDGAGGGHGPGAGGAECAAERAAAQRVGCAERGGPAVRDVSEHAAE